MFRFSGEVNAIFFSRASRNLGDVVFMILRYMGKQYLYIVKAETGSLARFIDLGEHSQVNFLHVDKFLRKDGSQIFIAYPSRWILLDFNGSRIADTRLLKPRKVLEISDYDKDGIKEILYCVSSLNMCNVYLGKYFSNQSKVTFISKYLCSLEGKIVLGVLRINYIFLLSDTGCVAELGGDSFLETSISGEGIVLANIGDIDCDLKEEIIVCRKGGIVEALEMRNRKREWGLKFSAETLVMKSYRLTSDDEYTFGLLHSVGGSLHYTCYVLLLKSEEDKNLNLYAVSGSNGEILWNYRVERQGTEEILVDTLDYNLDGTSDVVLGVKNSIYLLDGRYGFLLKKIPLNEKILFLKACDINGDGEMEVIIGTQSSIFALRL
ncbi:MAG: VCBS repeat-containing protein [Candidatus Bathyarchaeia archaeon]